MKTAAFTTVLPEALRTLSSCSLHSRDAANVFGTNHNNEHFSKVDFLEPLIPSDLALESQKLHVMYSLLLYFYKQENHASEGALLV